MSKKSFFIVISAVFMFLGCGGNKNKEEAEKPDTGNTEAVTDTDLADTGDTEAVTDTEPTDTEVGPDEDNTELTDTEAGPDEDNTDTGNITHDGCTTTESYGTNSLTRKETSEICYEKIIERSCYKSMNPDSELIESILQNWRYKKIVFNKESCKELYGSETVECPDFIPDFFKFSELAGCEIHTVDPNTSCSAPCYDLYFSTNDEYFQKASFEEFGTKYIRSVSSDGLVEFSSTIEYNGSISAAFGWVEKGADGTEIKKGVSIGMKIVDTRSDKCKDQEGKLYYEGDLIPEKCGILVCSENGWKISSDTKCRMCNLEESKTKYWECYDGSLLEWCNCVEDEETSKEWGEERGKWSCIDRIDLQCPPRIEECEDSEGRIYQHNEKIASECDYVYCTYNGWQTSVPHRRCNFSCTDFIGEKQSWVCADGVTEVDWCECVEDEEGGGIFTCIERADLNCPGGK